MRLRNGTHLVLYPLERKYPLRERNKGMRETMNGKVRKGIDMTMASTI